MADGSEFMTARMRALAAEGRHLTLLETPPARARFHPADGGAVRLGVARLGPEIVAELLRLFERERAWGLFDDLCAAADGLTPEPPLSAA
jgi:hypothetical protein